MNMVHSLNGVDIDKLGQLHKQSVFRHVDALREATILAMSNMLTANIDSGLTHAICEWVYYCIKGESYRHVSGYITV